MRRSSLYILLSAACFSPDGEPAAEGNDSTDAITNGPTTSGPGTMSGTSVSATEESADATSATLPTDDGSDETVGSTTALGDTTVAGSSSESGALPGCADFDGRVVYVNMEPTTLTMGIVDNAPSNITSDEFLVGDWPGYASDDADELFAMVEAHYAPYHVCLTRELPPVPDYSMILVSSETFMDNPNVIGSGNVDCQDAILDSVTVIILSEEAGIATPIKAIGLSKFIAEMFGLGSVENAPDDIMNFIISTTFNGATFTDACHLPIASFMCDAAVDCGAGEQQSGPYLESIFGPA